MNRSPRKNQGIALVITLVILVIATIVITAFVTSMRTERQAASAMANNERAKLIAQSALQHATAILDKNIPQPIRPGAAPTPQNWIINPGLLTIFSGADGSSPQYIPLSTNSGTSAPTTDCVNLNGQLLKSADYSIIPTGETLNASWVYVLQDPTAPASASNPIIGRYAFWMDDENNRININTAYGKPATLLNNIPGSSNSYMVRSNPLDQTADNKNTWFVTGSDPFQPDVGFNSIIGPGTTYIGTDGVNHITYPSLSPGDSSNPASGTNANAIGASGTKPNTSNQRYYPLWHPSAVNIDILPTSLSNSAPIGATDTSPAPGLLNRQSMADWVFNRTSGTFSGASTTYANWRLLQSPEQIKQFISTTGGTSSPNDFYTANKFNLTAYNRAPEFNVFGKPRLFMENRINAMQSGSAKSPADTCNGNLSGSELAFCQTPDIDPQGPSYFHGYENVAPSNTSAGKNVYYPDVFAEPMVANYLSGLLNRSDWPGMPATSFVNKWGGGSMGKMEADQVAWNIIAMGNYAANQEGDSLATTSWPDDQYTTFALTTGPSGTDSAGNYYSPSWNGASTQLTNRPVNLYSVADPNSSLRLGYLSGKAIMPYTPRPYLNEASLDVTVIPVTTGTGANPTVVPNEYYLQLSLTLELYVGRRGPPGTFWPHNNNLVFYVTHFFYTIAGTGTNGSPVTCQQAATGGPSYGNKGSSEGPNSMDYSGLSGASNCAKSGGASVYPWAGCLAGGYPVPVVITGTTVSGTTTTVNTTSPDTYLPVDSYNLLMTTIPGQGANEVDSSGTIQSNASYGAAGQNIWVCSGTKIQTVAGPPGTANLGAPLAPVSVPAKAQAFAAAIVNVQASARIALCSHDAGNTYEIVPVWDNVDTNASALAAPPGQPDSISWNFNIDLSSIQASSLATPTSSVTFHRSLEITDPRLGCSNAGTVWKAYPVTGAGISATGESFGGPNTDAAFTADNYAYFDFQGAGAGEGFYKNSPRPSIGFLDCVPTGMQRGKVDSQLTFGPSADKSQLPDWLMLDLVAPMFADMLQLPAAPYSYLHSTMGKINVNANIYPTLSSPSGVVLQRNLPLEALFKNTVPDSDLPILANNIINHQLSGQDFGAPSQYDYIGELCEVKGIADGSYTPGSLSGTKWQKEALIRNLANLITTQSNTFHVWGAAQSIKLAKAPGNTNNAIYQQGDTVTVIGEKRFESAIDRSVWPGVDGVPGNAHVTSGTYDQKSFATSGPVPAPFPWAAVTISATASSSAVVPATTATWAQFDGPDDPNAPRMNSNFAPSPGWFGSSTQPLQYKSSKLQDALNPARAYMICKPIMFRYITE